MSSAPFDPEKGLREEIEGLANVVGTITKLTSRSEQEVSEAEMKHDSLIKLEAYARGELRIKRAALIKLEKEKIK